VALSVLPPLPHCHNAHGLLHGSGLGCSPFARRYSGNRCLFLFLRVLRCFTSPGVASLGYSGLTLPQVMTCLISRPGFPIRASWDHSPYAAPPGLSQLITPFIASPCRGIHLPPLVAWLPFFYNTKTRMYTTSRFMIKC
jgi:hypothetical protein